MSDAKSFQAGWLLDTAQRAELLTRFPPRYGETVAHHITFKGGDLSSGIPPGISAAIVGEADDGAGVQAMVVAIDGTTGRPDGSTYHITWSLGPGRRARESNAVIADRGWRRLAEPLALRLHPKDARRRTTSSSQA